jgi:squalene-associated FAD-dependent desaturase
MADSPSQPTVAIVGGGLAGLAAACALSDSGFRVTLFERRPYLGGRASSYEHPGTGEVVDNCQHVLFGSCTNLIAFYRTIGILGKIRWFDRMTFVEPGGRQSELQPTFLPAPLHVMPSFLGFKFLGTWDKIVLSRALAALLTRTPKDDGRSFQEWLVQNRQTSATIERFWKPILVSALSEDLDRIAVPYAAQVVRESMKAPIARRMGIPSVPLTHLYDAAHAHITSRGGSVRLRSSAQAILPSDKGMRVLIQDAEEEFDYGVLAVPFDSLAKLLSDVPGYSELKDKIAHFETSPITGVHLWFDRQITDLPHAVLLDRTIQWMFHKSLLLDRTLQTNVGNVTERTAPNTDFVLTGGKTADSGTATALQGRPRLAQDVSTGSAGNVSKSRREDIQNPKSGMPSYVELVISSSKSLIHRSRQEIIDLALKELREFFPGASDANLIKATVIKEVNATFSPTPGIDRYRPKSQTPWPRVFLAGDWTATGWPATMEGAVRSGYLAAEALTKHTGVPKSFLVLDLAASGFMRLLGR